MTDKRARPTNCIAHRGDRTQPQVGLDRGQPVENSVASYCSVDFPLDLWIVGLGVVREFADIGPGPAYFVSGREAVVWSR